MMAESFFLTVDWCKKSGRGIFCDAKGNAFWKDEEPHTYEEMWGILDAFYVILSPQSLAFTEEEVAEFTYYRPLAEYSGQYGIALREKDVPIRIIQGEDYE